MKSILVLAAIATSASASAATVQPPVAKLYGHWQIVGVAVDDTGVQALVPDDPSYMGRRLTFRPTRLSWDKPRATSTERPCASPRLRQVPRDPDPDARAMVRKVGGPAIAAFSVGCAGGSWGPNDPPAPTILALPNDTIALWWFDNGLLQLRRAN